MEVWRDLLSSHQAQNILPSNVVIVKKYQSQVWRCSRDPSTWGGCGGENCEVWASLRNSLRSCPQTNIRDKKGREGKRRRP